MKVFYSFILFFVGSIFLLRANVFKDSTDVSKWIELPAETVSDSTIFMIVEEMPEFEGGQDALIKFISTETKFPKEALDTDIQGRVFVQFVVEKDGSIQEVEVIRKVHILLDNEALRVITLMNGKWKPGTQKGLPVRVKMVLPFNFTQFELKQKSKKKKRKHQGT